MEEMKVKVVSKKAGALYVASRMKRVKIRGKWFYKLFNVKQRNSVYNTALLPVNRYRLIKSL